MKGLVLAGGLGRRLWPLTKGVSKHLLPIYDKPMIYYPLWVLKLAHIQDILIVTKPEDLTGYQKTLGDGSFWGVNLHYQTQDYPGGVVQAIVLAQSFLKGEQVALILADNIFDGDTLSQYIEQGKQQMQKKGACLMSYPAFDTSDLGIVKLNTQGEPIQLKEKPGYPCGNLAVTGLYFYDQTIIEYAQQVKPSQTGELEISDLNQIYLNKKQLGVVQLPKSLAWFDAGSIKSLWEASQYVYFQQNQYKKVVGLKT